MGQPPVAPQQQRPGVMGRLGNMIGIDMGNFFWGINMGNFFWGSGYGIFFQVFLIDVRFQSKTFWKMSI